MAKTIVDPFVVQWPKRWTEDREIGPVIHYLNKFLHDLWLRSGGAVDDVDAAGDPDIISTLASLTALQQQVGSGDFLTVDTTGFTVDSTNQFADQVQA